MSLPNKNYDLKDAAHLFGIAEIEFYKILRGESEKYPVQKAWINSGNFRKDPARNKPYSWARGAGFLTTETRKRPANRNKNLKVAYVVTVITRSGIHELENQLGIASALPPMVLPLNEDTAIAVQKKQSTSEEITERERCLQELASMGLLNKAS